MQGVSYELTYIHTQLFSDFFFSFYFFSLGFWKLNLTELQSRASGHLEHAMATSMMMPYYFLCYRPRLPSRTFEHQRIHACIYMSINDIVYKETKYILYKESLAFFFFLAFASRLSPSNWVGPRPREKLRKLGQN